MKRLAIAERHDGQIPAVGRQQSQRALRQRQRRQLVERILRIQQVLIVHPHFFLANAQVEVQIAAGSSVERSEWLDERHRQVVAGHGLKDSLVVDLVEIEIAGSIAPQVNSRHHRQPRAHALDVHRLAAKDVAILALLNQPIAEIRAELQSVVPVEARERKLSLLAELPVVADDGQKGMRYVSLAIVDGVAGNRRVDGNEPGQVRESVISDAEQRQVVTPKVILAKAVELVLLAVFEAIEKSVAEGKLARNPGVGVGIDWAPASHERRHRGSRQ